MRKRVTMCLMACVVVAAAVLAGTVWTARPPRWSEPLAALTRDQVHAFLGVPDADFIPKGWEGWDQPVLVGAWVLRVYYDDAGQVLDTKVRFDVGFGYAGWDRSYADALRRIRSRA